MQDKVSDIVFSKTNPTYSVYFDVLPLLQGWLNAELKIPFMLEYKYLGFVVSAMCFAHNSRFYELSTSNPLNKITSKGSN